ncbi:hypothetical protein CC78DRAFT_544147 [Lojkania enalia]|uniref:Uncharacterized protein n=1 Tax=Lojkania enalia TaxID=147567 RepID=A0A9P4K9U5_9PLEO|nr:hypothetical protein CC78DRAFT_544147 [Didymosphaeria enalia]
MANIMNSDPSQHQNANCHQPPQFQPPPLIMQAPQLIRPGQPDQFPPPIQSVQPNSAQARNRGRELDWILKVVGVALAILFGVWAPISYKVTIDFNIENGVFQNQFNDNLKAIGTQAGSARLFQSSAADELETIRSKIDAIGSEGVRIL